jgi:hypothetical protein
MKVPTSDLVDRGWGMDVGVTSVARRCAYFPKSSSFGGGTSELKLGWAVVRHRCLHDNSNTIECFVSVKRASRGSTPLDLFHAQSGAHSTRRTAIPPMP